MSEEELITLNYRVDLKESGINKDEAIPLVNHIIAEVKEKYPEKAKDLAKIEIKDAGILEVPSNRSADGPTLYAVVETTLIITVVVAPIIRATWMSVVIPYLQKRLKLEEYKNE